MADEFFDAQRSAEDAAETNAAAMALALDGASARPELSHAIAAFLKEQRRLMEEQREQLRDQVRRMRLGIIDQRFSIALKAMTAFVGVAIAILFAWMVWSAANSGGLVIEPFSVPPDLAARGLTGEVVAAKLLDRLSQLQTETVSQRAPQTFQNYWGQDIKVIIPDTGVSLGELDRFLNFKLGHATRVSGEIVRQASGLAATARAQANGSITANGSEAAFDSLIRSVGEQIYRLTQPYLYGVWLLRHGRTNDALSVYVQLANDGPVQERGWGFVGWSNSLQLTEGELSRLAKLKSGVGVDPHLFLLRQNVALSDDELSRPEEAIATGRQALVLIDAAGHGGVRDSVVPYSRARLQSVIDANEGDYHPAAERLIGDFPDGASRVFTYSVTGLAARSFAGEHDLKSARAVAVMNWPGTEFSPSIKILDDLSAEMFTASQGEDWRRVTALDAKTSPPLSGKPMLRDLFVARIVPFVAHARARLNDFINANALIAMTPDHCDLCLRTRAKIAELEGWHANADWWFARAVAQNPSIPFAWSDWGEMLLHRGNYDAAIDKFREANLKGPHFADPLEMWGEALMQKSRSDLALEKFEEANQYAPHWGRLHLKWGEALMYAGKKDEAQKQFATASYLDLSAADSAALARARANLP